MPFCGCGAGSGSDARPQPALASSLEAQQAFQKVRARWTAAAAAQRVGLEPIVRDFLARFPRDPRTRTARLYLAWILVQKDAVSEARHLARLAGDDSAGAEHDLATVVEAAALVRQRQAAKALRLLEPLRGKVIDVDERLFYNEELVRAAVAAYQFEAAVGYMLDWAEQAPEGDVEPVKAQVEAMLRTVPLPALEKSLENLAALGEREESQSDRGAVVAWLKQAIVDRLTRAALEASDSELARRLLDTERPELRPDATQKALSRLAASGKLAAQVVGRALGFVLRVHEPQALRRSAEAVAAVSRALGLPQAAERPGSVRLLTRDAGGEPGAVERALAELAAEGAAVLVAGVTPDGATQAAAFAARERIPVVLLAGMSTPPPKNGFAFVVGEAPTRVAHALEQAMQQRGYAKVGHVGVPEVPCDAPAPTAGLSRFPVKAWQKDRIEALVFHGDAHCAREAIAEVKAARFQVPLVLGLEAAQIIQDFGDPATLAVAAGAYPAGLRASEPKDMAEWLGHTGQAPSWYTVLGHDAGLLAAEALGALPLERAEDAAAVQSLHARARDRLATATAGLWSTERRGFEGGRVLRRELSVVAAGSRAR